MTALPRLLVLTDRTQCTGPLVETVAAAVAAGARAVVLREKDLPGGERDRLADRLAAVLAPVNGLLVRAGAGEGAAVHLAAADPFPVPRPALVGRSCHD
ncbi:MAG: thiamine monophosphate synthase, partial [Modestobacter sp.]|nr:thiamine monophosphate synthase [Modestobacter sp.]